MVWPMIYRVRHPGGGQDDPVLKEYLWEDLPPYVKERKRHVLSSMHRNGMDDDMVCFYSGVNTYISIEELGYAPWEATREHLVAVANCGNGNGGSNIVFAGSLLNSKLGHNPLPIKLLVRQHLLSCDYNRQDSTYLNFKKIIGHVISFENTMKVDGRYPWQLSTYSKEEQCYAKIESFNLEMRAAEEEFLSLPPSDRREWIQNFKWRW